MQKKICPLHHFQLTLMIHNKVFFFEHHQIYLSIHINLGYWYLLCKHILRIKMIVKIHLCIDIRLLMRNS
jgi:hypothetical protein